MDVLFLAYAAAVGFAAFLSTSTVGIGSALILTPLLMVRLDPAQAVGVIAPATLLNTALTAWVHRRSIPRDVLGLTAAAAVPACIVGAVFAGRVPPAVTQVAIALAIGLALGMERGLKKAVGGGRVGVVGWGGAAGLIGGVAGTFGPPLAISFLARGLTGPAFVGAMTAVGVCINLVRLPAYVATGVLGNELLPLAGVLGVSAAVAVYAGKLLLARIDPKNFRGIVDGILAVIALVLVVRAVGGGLIG